MIIRIPARLARAAVAAIDWLSAHTLPPPTPVTRKIRWLGRPIDLTDLGTVAWAAALAIAMWVWTGSWLWLPAVAVMMAFLALLMPPRS